MSLVVVFLLHKGSREKESAEKLETGAGYDFDDVKFEDCCKCGRGCKIYLEHYLVLLLGQLIATGGTFLAPPPVNPSMIVIIAKAIGSYLEVIIQMYTGSRILYTKFDNNCLCDVCCPICYCCCNSPNVFCLIYGCRCNVTHGVRFKWSTMLGTIYTTPIEVLQLSLVLIKPTGLSAVTISGVAIKIIYKIMNFINKRKKIRTLFKEYDVKVPDDVNLMTGLRDTGIKSIELSKSDTAITTQNTMFESVRPIGVPKSDASSTKQETTLESVRPVVIANGNMITCRFCGQANNIFVIQSFVCWNCRNVN